MTRSPTMAVPRAATAVRIDFAADPSGAGERMLRRYVDPRPAVAIAMPVAAVPPTDASGDALLVLMLPDRSPASLADAWLAEADPDAPRPARAPIDGGHVRWRAGRAVVAGAVAGDVLMGLSDFAFYEAELRLIEAALPPLERAAADDVRLAYRIDDGDRSQWPRLGATMESLARLRLTFARLEPRLGRPSRSLPPAGRQAFRRLVVRADVEDRLAGVSDRLEACEDLYEGAVDRVIDHRWWRRGHRLEAIIVGLLAIEGLQLAAELALRLWQGR